MTPFFVLFLPSDHRRGFACVRRKFQRRGSPCGRRNNFRDVCPLRRPPVLSFIPTRVARLAPRDRRAFGARAQIPRRDGRAARRAPRRALARVRRARRRPRGELHSLITSLSSHPNDADAPAHRRRGRGRTRTPVQLSRESHRRRRGRARWSSAVDDRRLATPRRESPSSCLVVLVVWWSLVRTIVVGLVVASSLALQGRARLRTARVARRARARALGRPPRAPAPRRPRVARRPRRRAGCNPGAVRVVRGPAATRRAPPPPRARRRRPRVG